MTATRTASPPSVPESPTRRNWLASVLVIALLVVGAGVIGWWLGSAGDDAEVPAIVDNFADAFMAGDAEAVAALHTADGVWDDRAIPRSARTTSGIRSIVSQGMAYLDVTAMELQTAATGEGVVVAEWTWSGMSSSADRSPSDKTPFSAELVTVFEMDDDLITRTIFYYNVDELWN